MQRNHKIESGRSMTETIAVLVIIAILTIASLGGFSYLMTTARRRQTIDQISAVALGMRSGNLAQRYGEGDKIPVKTIVRGLNTRDEIAVLPDNEDSYVSVTSFGVNTYMMELQVAPGTCEEFLEKMSDPERSPLSPDIVGMAAECPKGDGSCQTVSPRLLDVIGNARGNEKYDKLEAACASSPRLALVWGCPNINPYFYGGKCHKCVKGQVEDKNGHCCSKERYNSITKLCAGCADGYELDENNHCCLNKYLHVLDNGRKVCCENDPYADKNGTCCSEDKYHAAENICCPKINQVVDKYGECCPEPQYNPVTQTCPACALVCAEGLIKNDECTKCVCKNGATPVCNKCAAGEGTEKCGKVPAKKCKGWACPTTKCDDCPEPKQLNSETCACVCPDDKPNEDQNGRCCSDEEYDAEKNLCGCEQTEDCAEGFTFDSSLAVCGCVCTKNISECTGPKSKLNTAKCQCECPACTGPKSRLVDRENCICDCPKGTHWAADIKQCVVCVTNADCPNDTFTNHICDTEHHVCVECVSNKDCTTESDNLAVPTKDESPTNPPATGWNRNTCGQDGKKDNYQQCFATCQGHEDCPAYKAVVLGREYVWRGICWKSKCAECDKNYQGHNTETGAYYGECPSGKPVCHDPATEGSRCGQCPGVESGGPLVWNVEKQKCLCPESGEEPVCLDGACTRKYCPCTELKCTDILKPDTKCGTCVCPIDMKPVCKKCKAGEGDLCKNIIDTMDKNCTEWNCVKDEPAPCPVEGQVKDRLGNCCAEEEIGPRSKLCPCDDGNEHACKECTKGTGEQCSDAVHLATDGNNICKTNAWWCPSCDKTCTTGLDLNKNECACECSNGATPMCTTCRNTTAACSSITNVYDPKCTNWSCCGSKTCDAPFVLNDDCDCVCPSGGRAICLKCAAGEGTACEDITNPEDSRCSEWLCAGCTKNSDCPSDKFIEHICDTSTHTCVECLNNDQHCTTESDNLANPTKDESPTNPPEGGWRRKFCGTSESKKCGPCILSYHATNEHGECPQEEPKCYHEGYADAYCGQCPCIDSTQGDLKNCARLIWSVADQDCVCPNGQVAVCLEKEGDTCMKYECRSCVKWDENRPDANNGCANPVDNKPFETLDTCLENEANNGTCTNGCCVCSLDYYYTGDEYAAKVTNVGKCGDSLPFCDGRVANEKRKLGLSTWRVPGGYFGPKDRLTDDSGKPHNGMTQKPESVVPNTGAATVNGQYTYQCRECLKRKRERAGDMAPDYGCTWDKPVCSENSGTCDCSVTSTDCPVDMYCTKDNLINKPKKHECRACPPNSIRDLGSKFCVCKPGYHKVCGTTESDTSGKKCGTEADARWTCAEGCLVNTDCQEDHYCKPRAQSGSTSAGMMLGECRPCSELNDGSIPVREKTEPMCRGCFCTKKGPQKNSSTGRWYCPEPDCEPGTFCLPNYDCKHTYCTPDSNCGDGSKPEVCHMVADQGTCVTKPKFLYRIKGYTSNTMTYYFPPHVDKWKMSLPSAAAFCAAYGMRLPTIQEACFKDLHANSGHDCPNITGVRGSGTSNREACKYEVDGGTEKCTSVERFSITDWYVDGMGTFWTDSHLPNSCNALRVTTTCGNNHPTRMCENFYPICVKDGEIGAVRDEMLSTDHTTCACGLDENTHYCKASPTREEAPCGHTVVDYTERDELGRDVPKRKCVINKAPTTCGNLGYYYDSVVNQCLCNVSECACGQTGGRCNDITLTCGTNYILVSKPDGTCECELKEGNDKCKLECNSNEVPVLRRNAEDGTSTCSCEPKPISVPYCPCGTNEDGSCAALPTCSGYNAIVSVTDFDRYGKISTRCACRQKSQYSQCKKVSCATGQKAVVRKVNDQVVSCGCEGGIGANVAATIPACPCGTDSKGNCKLLPNCSGDGSAIVSFTDSQGLGTTTTCDCRNASLYPECKLSCPADKKLVIRKLDGKFDMCSCETIQTSGTITTPSNCICGVQGTQCLGLNSVQNCGSTKVILSSTETTSEGITTECSCKSKSAFADKCNKTCPAGQRLVVKKVNGAFDSCWCATN